MIIWKFWNHLDGTIVLGTNMRILYRDNVLSIVKSKSSKQSQWSRTKISFLRAPNYVLILFVIYQLKCLFSYSAWSHSMELNILVNNSIVFKLVSQRAQIKLTKKTPIFFFSIYLICEWLLNPHESKRWIEHTHLLEIITWMT